ncbi:unknown [Fusobacterium sp. CAG:439]|nr:unknown [Fusobacterium sp. CAG:439]HIT92149.1 hypothetical protein [Candidatus Stercorousia faecigallinarum]
MTFGRVDAIGFDDKANKTEYATQVKKKNPWENIGALMNGFGSYINNLPDNFNSAFTVGKQGGADEVGAFKA